MQVEPKRQLTFRDLISWNVMDVLEKEGIGKCVPFERLFDIDPVKDMSINVILGKLYRQGVIKKSGYRQGVEVVNPLQLAVLKAKLECGRVEPGQSIIHDTRGVWGE